MTLFVYCDLFMAFKEWWRHMLVKLVVIEGRGRCEFLITCARAGFGWPVWSLGAAPGHCLHDH